MLCMGRCAGECRPDAPAPLPTYCPLRCTTCRTSDAAARERLGALPVFVMALQCVPFVMPEHWAAGGIFDDLPGYTIHAEQSMRQVGGCS